MKILYNFERAIFKKRPFVTIGVFDGVHLGHKLLLKKMISGAHKEKKEAVVITFSAHPHKILYPGKHPPMLLSLSHRLKIMGAIGVDRAIVLNFNKFISKISAEEFVKKILVDKLKIDRLYIGENFRLGRRREGGSKILKEFSKKYGFRLNIVKPKKFGKNTISSTLVRRLVLRGKIKEASLRLGGNVSILGTVVSGDRRGRILGFPTANLDLHHEAIPPSGVYAVYARLNGKLYQAILNIGFRPTFKKNKKEKTVEVHLFDFNRNIYRKDMEVIFVKKIRGERHFSSRKLLENQIHADIKKAMRALKIDSVL